MIIHLIYKEIWRFYRAKVSSDLYVQNGLSWHSQVDVVAVTEVGIIVVEVKDYSGWIFGKGYQTNWCQVLKHDKFHFYNPVLQNDRHSEVLRGKLENVANVPFYSVVVFYGNCRFKDVSQISRDTHLIYSHQLKGTIKSVISSNPPCLYQNKEALIAYLQMCQDNGNNQNIVLQHVKNIHREFDNN